MSTRPFHLRPFERGKAANLYVLQFDDQPKSEIEQFFLREAGLECDESERQVCTDGNAPCRGVCERPEHRAKLWNILDLAVRENGFRPEFFRPFDKYKYPICAIATGPYRLFGMRFDTELFVVGGGGVKFVRSDGDDPLLKAAIDDVTEAARRLRDRMVRRGMNHPPRDGNGLLHLPDNLLSFPH